MKSTNKPQLGAGNYCCQEFSISIAQPRVAFWRAQLNHTQALKQQLKKRWLKASSVRRRIVRYSLLLLNVLLLGAAFLFVRSGSASGQVSVVGVATSASTTRNQSLSNPLDQVSSADIAQSVAIMSNSPEVVAVQDEARSVSAELAVTPAQDTVIPKPQVVSTALKSRKDIQNYVTQPGDSISSLAAQFNVTSNSIKWSNNLISGVLNAGTHLVIPPVNGIVYTVKAGDTLDSLAQKFSANKSQITAFNDAEISGIQVGEQIVIPDGQIAAAHVYSFLAAYGSNGYDYGFCTWYVASQIAVPSNWGNASTWAYYAALSGWTVSSTPVVGAIAQNSYMAGGLGHVAIVDAVSPDGTQIQYRDMNGVAGWGRVGYSGWVSASYYQHYIYH